MIEVTWVNNLIFFCRTPNDTSSVMYLSISYKESLAEQK